MKMLKKILLAASVLMFAGIGGAFAETYYEDAEVFELGTMSFQDFSSYFGKVYSSSTGADEIAEEIFDGEIGLTPKGSSDLTNDTYGLLGTLRSHCYNMPKDTVVCIAWDDILIIAHNSWVDYNWYPFFME